MRARCVLAHGSSSDAHRAASVVRGAPGLTDRWVGIRCHAGTGGALKRVDAKERQSEVGEALEQAVKGRLVPYDAHKHRFPVVTLQAHAFECRPDLVAELALDLDRVRVATHERTVARVARS